VKKINPFKLIAALFPQHVLLELNSANIYNTSFSFQLLSHNYKIWQKILNKT